MWRLANARDRDTGEGLGAAELHDEILTLGATSATSLRPLPWIWYLLATHPEAEQRLHAELDQVVGDRAPAVGDLAEVTWLRQVVDETMRLYPPLPIMMMRAGRRRRHGVRPPNPARIDRRDPAVGRAPPPQAVARPDRFDPERFSPDAVAARSRYAYLPFAVGPHVCVGASMAMLQLTITVAVMARHFRFRLVPGRTVEPTAWTNIRPRDGIWVTVEPRLSAPSRAA